MPSLPRIVTLGALTASFASAGVATAQAPESAFRGVGNTAMDVRSSTQFNYLGVFAVQAGTNNATGESLVAKGTITVDAATRKKYKLPSSLVAKGTWKKNGESGGIRFTASSAVRKALKKVKTLPVTFTLDVDSPVNETVKKKATLGKPGRLFLRSSKDTVAVDGTGRG